MKTIRLFRFVFILLCSILVVACDKDESFIKPSTSTINMGDEGGEIEITLNDIDWEIAGVLKKTVHYEEFIYGIAYLPDGTMICENHKLYLQDLGKLETLWDNKGFSIVREIPLFLKFL
ncbi:MAG: hypothetical protein LUH22_06805 [Bacteroides sp.]|nr:hypothetical protein [Bacteroides sp.]